MRYVAPFTIESINNHTDKELEVELVSLGSPTEPIRHMLTIPAHQTVRVNLEFGRQEQLDIVPPVGYLLTNVRGDKPFKTIRFELEHVEDPLVDIPIVHGYRYTSFPFIYHWFFYCNDTQVARFSSPEHKRVRYEVTIGDECLIGVREC